jgi:hypothetical protein
VGKVSLPNSMSLDTEIKSAGAAEP